MTSRTSPQKVLHRKGVEGSEQVSLQHPVTNQKDKTLSLLHLTSGVYLLTSKSMNIIGGYHTHRYEAFRVVDNGE